MSWCIGYNSKKDFEDEVRASHSTATDSPHYSQDQVDAARKAVKLLLESSTVGLYNEYDFNISLSGHANPAHRPASGWANDCITISVSQK